MSTRSESREMLFKRDLERRAERGKTSLAEKYKELDIISAIATSMTLLGERELAEYAINQWEALLAHKF